MPVRVRVLGDASVADGADVVRPLADRRSALLWFLTVTGEPVTRERLATLLWPDATSTDARRNLRTLLMRVRRLPYAAGLQTDGDHVLWPVHSDVAAFRHALRGRAWKDAVARYGGELLPGVTLDGIGQAGDWLESARRDLHDAFRRAALARADQLRRADAAAAEEVVVAHFEHVLTMDPLDDTMARRAIEDLAARGCHADARRIGRAHRERLRRELGLEPGAGFLALLDALVPDAASGPTPVESTTPPPRAVPPALPRPATPFIGRDRERRELARRLGRDDCRLLTLTGTPGVGKTRLALRLAEDVADRYPDGAGFVDLTQVQGERATAIAIVDALGLAPAAGTRPEQALLEALRESHRLLVLDEADDALDAVPLLVRLLHAAPGVDLVVTSRERLGVPEEWLVQVKGLGTDAESDDARLADAVQLFMTVVERIEPRFRADAETLEHVTAICRAVDGLPLAVELAAAAARSLPLSEMVRAIDEELVLLRRGWRDHGSRHRSVQASFERSWSRLAPDEAQGLASLAVFPGAFRHEAAAAVAGTSLAQLATYVDASLLRLDQHGCYDLHPLLRQLLREKLTADPQTETRVLARFHARQDD